MSSNSELLSRYESPPEDISWVVVRLDVFMTLGVFRHLKPGKEGAFLASQQAFTESLKGLRGFHERIILRDEAIGALVVISRWESREDFEAAGPVLMKYRAERSREGKDFSAYIDEPEELYRLVPVDLAH